MMFRRTSVPERHALLGLLDTAENILANKISAVVDRKEPKDLADIWGFCTKMNLSLDAAITGAQSKAAGIFPADLARILNSASRQDLGSDSLDRSAGLPSILR